MFGVGIIKLKISNYYFDIFRISEEKKEFIFIDSTQAMSIEDFSISVAAFFQAYSNIFDSHEIREHKFSKSFFLFPCEVLTNMCNKLIDEEKYQRTLKIIHEAN